MHYTTNLFIYLFEYILDSQSDWKTESEFIMRS